MIVYAVRTDAECVHDENQDRVRAEPCRGTFVVADGMGGLADPDGARSVTGAMVELNEQVRRTALCGPGTTGAATALLLVRGRAALAVHLGDSRIYHARSGRVARLTRDHALGGGLLTRFVGMGGAVVPGVSRHELRPRDRLRLCTDGLTGGVEDAELGELLSGARNVHRASRALIDAARAGGATDDVSVIAVECGTGEVPR